MLGSSFQGLFNFLLLTRAAFFDKIIFSGAFDLDKFSYHLAVSPLTVSPCGKLSVRVFARTFIFLPTASSGAVRRV